MIQFKCSKREYKYKYLVVGYHFSLHICISNKCWWSGQNRKVWTNIATASTRFLLGKFLNKTQLNEPWSCYWVLHMWNHKGENQDRFSIQFLFQVRRRRSIIIIVLFWAVLTQNSINQRSVRVSHYQQRHRTNIDTNKANMQKLWGRKSSYGVVQIPGMEMIFHQ